MISPQETDSDSLPVFVKWKLDHFELSNRRTEVMKELLKGYEYQDIADRLFISLETVRSHVKNIFRKLSVLLPAPKPMRELWISIMGWWGEVDKIRLLGSWVIRYSGFQEKENAENLIT